MEGAKAWYVEWGYVYEWLHILIEIENGRGVFEKVYVDLLDIICNLYGLVFLHECGGWNVRFGSICHFYRSLYTISAKVKNKII